MARILHLTTGLTGMLTNSVVLAGRLTARGHEVHLASHRDCRARVEAAGLPFHHLTARAAHRAAFDAAPSREAQQAARRRSLHDREVEDLVATVRPDLLLVDAELQVALVVTRPLGIPTVVVAPWWSMLPSWTNPPMHTSLRPGPRALLAWLRLWAARLRRVTRTRVRRAVRDDVPPPLDDDCRSRLDLLELARTRGVDLRRHTTLLAWLEPHTWTRLPTISCTVAALEFGPVRDRPTQYVGPMVPATDPAPDRAPGWARFLATRDTTRPLVYGSHGSMWRDDGLVAALVEAGTLRPDWDVVVGLGGLAPSAAAGPVPANVLLLDWAPQVDVLRHAAAAVVHGGIGTLHECIAAGVPMVCHSHGRVDANGTVARIVHHGLGVAVEPGNVRGADLVAALQTVMADDGFRRRGAAIRAAVEQEVRAATAERLLEGLLEGA